MALEANWLQLLSIMLRSMTSLLLEIPFLTIVNNTLSILHSFFAVIGPLLFGSISMFLGASRERGLERGRRGRAERERE